VTATIRYQPVDVAPFLAQNLRPTVFMPRTPTDQKRDGLGPNAKPLFSGVYYVPIAPLFREDPSWEPPELVDQPDVGSEKRWKNWAKTRQSEMVRVPLFPYRVRRSSPLKSVVYGAQLAMVAVTQVPGLVTEATIFTGEPSGALEEGEDGPFVFYFGVALRVEEENAVSEVF
jgi:hypothetical protein